MDVFCCFKVNAEDTERSNILKSTFEKIFTPFVLNKCMRPLIIVVFFGWHILSVLVLPDISLGLEQDLALPKDSYIKNYLKVRYGNL